MGNLIAFLSKYHHWFLFLLLEAVSMVLLFRFNNYQGSVWFSSANAVSGKLFEWNSEVESFFSLTKVNDELTQRNLYLEQQLHALNEELGKVKGDTLDLKSGQMALLKGFKIIPAKVVSNSLDKADNLMTIDKGYLDGVQKDMGVACGTGVVGIVYMVSAHYSVVIPLLHSQSNLSCKIEGSGYYGYLHWTGGRADMAFVDDIPRHARFKLYSKVITSGYSALFPPGILVGKVMHVYNSEDGLSYRLQVKLSTDFGNLRNVCVIDNAPMKEKLEVMRAAQDSLKPANDP